MDGDNHDPVEELNRRMSVEQAVPIAQNSGSLDGNGSNVSPYQYPAQAMQTGQTPDPSNLAHLIPGFHYKIPGELGPSLQPFYPGAATLGSHPLSGGLAANAPPSSASTQHSSPPAIFIPVMNSGEQMGSGSSMPHSIQTSTSTGQTHPASFYPAVQPRDQIYPGLNLPIGSNQSAQNQHTEQNYMANGLFQPGARPDDLPLSQRLGGRTDSAQGSEEADDVESDSDEDNVPKANFVQSYSSVGSSSERRQRRNILPRILKGQRCGECHTCRNPQMKKACLTMRQRQMEELQSKGELPISMIAQPVNRSGALPPPMASVKRKFEPPTTSSQPLKRSVSSPESPEDPFTREVAAITNRKGGVEAKFLNTLQKMYQREKHLEKQLVLMTILKQSPPGTVQEAVRNQKIVFELQAWMQNAVEQREFRLAYRVLETLDKLPIDLNVLKKTGIGKTMARLRKSGPEEIKKGAEDLITKWKKVVDPATAGPQKRPREATDIASDSKKLKQEDAPQAPVLPRQTSVDSRDSNKVKQKAAPVEVDDTAMFERKKPPTIDSLSQIKKAHQIKLLDDEQSKQVKGSSDAARASATDPSSSNEAAPSGLEGPAKSGGSTQNQKTTDLGGATTNLALPLGSSRLTNISSGVTRIGGIEHTLTPLSLPTVNEPLSAAARAAEAAARIPDPPKGPSKIKLKTVSWVKDEDLVRLRHFKERDPVISVREDVDPIDEIQAQDETAEPPGFHYAAMREHQNEAAALKRFRQNITAKEDDDESDALHPGVQLQDPEPNAKDGQVLSVPHLAPAPHFQAMVDWPITYNGPPLAINSDFAFGIPTDDVRTQTESFQEMAKRVSARPAVIYPTTGHIPPSPAEPPEDSGSKSSGTTISIPCPRLEPAPALPPIQALQVQPPNLGNLQIGAPFLMQAPPVAQFPGGPPQNGVPPVGQPPLQQGYGPSPAMQGHVENRPSDGNSQTGPRRGEAPQGGRTGRDIPRSRGRGRGRFGRGREGDAVRGRGPDHDGHLRTSEHRKTAGRCKWHFTERGCRNGDKCRFSHDPSS